MSRQIDALIAEHVFGWKDIVITESWRKTKQGSTERYDEYNNEIHYFDKKGRHLVPHYSTRIEDAWLVVEKMGMMFHMTKGVEGFFCAFAAPFTAEYGSGIRQIDARAETMPMAICLAALKALGVKYE